MAARSGMLGLGWRLYPGNMQSIFNKDLTRFIQSLSRERQNRASKRKALPAAWGSEDDGVFRSEYQKPFSFSKKLGRGIKFVAREYS